MLQRKPQKILLLRPEFHYIPSLSPTYLLILLAYRFDTSTFSMHSIINPRSGHPPPTPTLKATEYFQKAIDDFQKLWKRNFAFSHLPTFSSSLDSDSTRAALGQDVSYARLNGITHYCYADHHCITRMLPGCCPCAG